MLQIQDLTYSIGERDLLDHIDWQIPNGKRIALVGPNGAGKTTLLRIIHGEIQHYGGRLNIPKNYTLGYLPQEELSVGKGTILETVLKGHDQLVALENQMHSIHQKLESNSQDQPSLLVKLGRLQDQFENLGGYTIESEAKEILSGLGFLGGDFFRPVAEFSGGWRMRVYLCRLLIQKPDLLLLDEPTNHLDLPSLEWLEQYLMKFPGSIVMVSHDRFFIDRLSDEIHELDRGQITKYVGNYHFFEKEKVHRLELLRKKQEELRVERERHQRFIDRFRYKATKATQVQSRIKLLEKMETVELPPPPRKIQFQLKVDKPSYHDVLHIENMSFKYDKEWVLQNITFDMYRGDRVALIGVNGAGKTTFTRLIMNQLAPQEGSIQHGKRVTMGYHAQHQIDALDLQSTVLDVVTPGPGAEKRARDILGVFQFSGDDVFKKVEVLSGGEKARASLAKVLLSPVNFLIMDEPTNHLDKVSKEALEEALIGYDGTLLLISHDRYFLDKLVNKVIALDSGMLRLYEGNYTDYLRKRESEASNSQETSSDSYSEKKTDKKLANEERRRLKKECNRLEQALQKVEKEIHNKELTKTDIESKLSQSETYEDAALYNQLTNDLAEVSKTIEELMGEWESIHQKRDRCSQMIGD